MPIRSYFLVIGTALAAGIWGLGWYLEPPKPQPVAQSAHASALAATPVSSPGSSSPVSTATTTGQAPPSPAPQPPAAASKPLEPTVAETAKPSHVAAKPKKRKHIAQRRQHRNSNGTAYADGSLYGYSAYQPAYQPFSGFRGW